MSGTKPLPELMLTKICHHVASLGHSELNNPRLLRHLTQGDPQKFCVRRILANHGVPSFNCGTAPGTKKLREKITFPDFKCNCHDIIPAWYIRRNASEHPGGGGTPSMRDYAGNGLTLLFTEIWSLAAAATLDLNLAVVPLHEEYKPCITVTNAQGENIIILLLRGMISSHTILGTWLLIHDGIEV